MRPFHLVVNPRGSWLAKHNEDEVATLWKKRKEFDMRTKKGTVHVVPKKKKRIRVLKKKLPEQTIIELYAEQTLRNDKEPKS